jgi:hypothetical protein
VAHAATAVAHAATTAAVSAREGWRSREKCNGEGNGDKGLRHFLISSSVNRMSPVWEGLTSGAGNMM